MSTMYNKITLLGHETELRIKRSPSPCGIYIQHQGSANYSWSPVFCFHKQSVTGTELYSFICVIIYGCFHATTTGMSSCNTDGWPIKLKMSTIRPGPSQKKQSMVYNSLVSPPYPPSYYHPSKPISHPYILLYSIYKQQSPPR